MKQENYFDFSYNSFQFKQFYIHYFTVIIAHHKLVRMSHCKISQPDQLNENAIVSSIVIIIHTNNQQI